MHKKWSISIIIYIYLKHIEQSIILQSKDKLICMVLVLLGVWFQVRIINEPLEYNIKRYFKRFILSVDQSIIPSKPIYYLCINLAGNVFFWNKESYLKQRFVNWWMAAIHNKHFKYFHGSINNISMVAIKEAFFLITETFSKNNMVNLKWR